MEVLKIVVLVKLGDGTVRQVSAKEELRRLALNMLVNENGALDVSVPIDNILIGNL